MSRERGRQTPLMPDSVSGYSVVDGRQEKRLQYPWLSFGKLMAVGWVMDHPDQAEKLATGGEVLREHLRIAMRSGLGELVRLADLWQAARPTVGESEGSYVSKLNNNFSLITPTIPPDEMSWVRSALNNEELAIGWAETPAERTRDQNWVYKQLADKVANKILDGPTFTGSLPFFNWPVPAPNPRKMKQAWEDNKMSQVLVALAESLSRYHSDNPTLTRDLQHMRVTGVTQCSGVRVNAVVHDPGIGFSTRLDRLSVKRDGDKGSVWKVVDFRSGWLTGGEINTHKDQALRLAIWLTAKCIGGLDEGNLCSMNGRAVGLNLNLSHSIPTLRNIDIRHVRLFPRRIDPWQEVMMSDVSRNDWETSEGSARMYMELNEFMDRVKQNPAARGSLG